MKRIYTVMTVLLMCSNLQAQYKKASFLSKAGRTHELAWLTHFTEGGSIPGIAYGFGIDAGKRFFYWTDIEILLPSAFKYTTVDYNDNQTMVTVAGKTKTAVSFRYNFAYYISNRENTDSKLNAFIACGFNFAMLGEAKNVSIVPSVFQPVKYLDDTNLSFGANFGLGGIYNFSDQWGIKLTAGYDVQSKPMGADASPSYIPFKIFSNHPYVGVGIRFIIAGDVD